MSTRSLINQGNINIKVESNTAGYDDEKYRCALCLRVFASDSELEEHWQRHRGEMYTPCGVNTLIKQGAECCDPSTTSVHTNATPTLGINQHSIDAVNDKNDITNIRPTRRNTLHRQRQVAAHKVVNSGDKPLECKTCDKTFVRVKSWIKHMNKAHFVEHMKHESHICDICGKTFPNTSDLTRHFVSHSDDKPHKCDTCGKKFAQSVHLRGHMSVHTGADVQNCHICSKTFASRNTLRSHMIIHSGKKQHECSICEKKFYQKNSLKNHMITHTGERLHKCDICGKSYTRSSILKDHVLIMHHGEKRHKCDTCGEAFARRKALHSHIARHQQD